LQTTCPNVGSNFFGNRMQPAVVSEVAIDLKVPGSIIALSNKGGQFCQFIRGEAIYCSLYFGETHNGSVSKTRRERNSPM
jgi:hypothetical protein